MYKFFLKNIPVFLISKVLSVLVIRNKKNIVFGSEIRGESVFLHNTKYLSLYLNSHPNYNVIWLASNKEFRKKMLENGYKRVYSQKSIKGMYYALTSKYVFTDFECQLYVSQILIEGAKKINLWHGIPLKKIYNDTETRNSKIFKLKRKIYRMFLLKEDLYVVNSEYEQGRYETAFLTKKKNIKILGSPRIDVLYHDFDKQDLFMEKDYKNIKAFKEQGKKLFIYMPTFRDTGKDISSWLKSERLKEFLEKNNAMLICKLHHADKNSLDFDLPNSFYKLENNSDIYSILKFTDALITDYSSINYDYLHLNKPIIYYVPDIKEYQEQCRGFYIDYNEFTVGDKTSNEDEIIDAMTDVVNGVDNYKNERKILLNEMFDYQDGKNCERVEEFLRSLNND